MFWVELLGCGMVEFKELGVGECLGLDSQYIGILKVESK